MPKQATLFEYLSLRGGYDGYELQDVGNPENTPEPGRLFVPKEDFDALLEEYEALRMSQLVGRHTRG